MPAVLESSPRVGAHVACPDFELGRARSGGRCELLVEACRSRQRCRSHWSHHVSLVTGRPPVHHRAMAGLGPARGSRETEPAQRAEAPVRADFKARVLEALDRTRSGYEAESPPLRSASLQASGNLPILSPVFDTVRLRESSTKVPDRPTRIWALLSMVQGSSPRELGLAVGYGPRGRAPATSLERALFDEAKAQELTGPSSLAHRLASDTTVAVHPDLLITRALLTKLLLEFVDESGRFDERGFVAKYPDSAGAVLTGLARAAPAREDPFGQSLDFHVLDAVIELLSKSVPSIDREVIGGIHQIPTSLPAVDFVKSQAKGKPFEGFVLLGVQHLLATQAPMLSAFEELGMKAEDIHLLGVPYSTCPLMKRAFAQRGYDVFQGDQNYGRGGFHEHREKDIREVLGSLIGDAEYSGKKVMVLDDGGLVSSVVAKEYREFAHLFRFVEQTTRGITEAKRVDLDWPVVNVAESSGKKLEAVHIARTVCRALMTELRGLSIHDPRGMKLTLTGYGTIGREMALLLRSLGFDLTVVEKTHSERGKQNFARAREDGFSVVTDLATVASTTRVLVGATGHRSITLSDIEKLPPGAIVASASSAEAEVPSEEIRDACKKHVPGALGRTTEYVLGHKSFVLLRDGRPVNFDQRLENVEPEAIQLTRGLMLLGALQAVQTKGTGLEPLDESGPQAGLKKLIEKLWRGFKPVPVMPKSQRPQAQQMPSASAEEWRWESFFAACPEVYPRTARGRTWLGSAVFRDPDGELWFRRKDLDEVQLHKIPAPKGSGKVAHLEFVTHEVARITLSDQKGGTQLLIGLGKDAEVLRSTPAADVRAIRQRGDSISPRSIERSESELRLVDDSTGKTLEKVALDPGAVGAGRLEFLRDPPIYFGGDLSKGWHVLQTVEDPPALRLYDESLAMLRAIELPDEVVRLERVDSQGVGKGMSLGLGRDKDGAPLVFRIDAKDGRVHKPVRLPAGATMKDSIIVPPFEKAIVYYLPKDTPDEEHLVKSLEI